MLKLILQLIVGTVVWFALADLAIGWKLSALVVSATVVHHLWERVVFDPFLYMGAMSVANDDPLMLAAREEGKATLPKFLEIYPQHERDSIVKFPFETDAGNTEHLWGDLLRINGDQAVVYLRTPPIEHSQPLESEMTIPVGSIEDWQIEFPDGTLRGGYTHRAMLKIYQRHEGALHPKLLPHFDRFRDIDW